MPPSLCRWSMVYNDVFGSMLGLISQALMTTTTTIVMKLSSESLSVLIKSTHRICPNDQTYHHKKTDFLVEWPRQPRQYATFALQMVASLVMTLSAQRSDLYQ